MPGMGPELGAGAVRREDKLESGHEIGILKQMGLDLLNPKNNPYY